MIAAVVCTPEEKRAALECAVHSRTFARAEQLRSFLHFIGEAEINGTFADLTEYMIGVKVLGRPEGYAPAEDSSVRTRAYELRQKLQKLYSTELPQQPVQISIPKGSYIPHFLKLPPPEDHPRSDTSQPPGQQGGDGAVQPVRRRRIAILGFLLAAAMGAAITLLAVGQFPRRPQIDPVLAEAWKLLAKGDTNITLSVAAPLHLIFGPEGRDTLGLPVYPAPRETSGIYRQHRPLASGARLDMTFTDNAVGFGTMNGVVTTVATLRSLGASYQILPDRAAPISALRNRNVILFGNPTESVTIAQAMENAPLLLDYEPSARVFVIRDRTSGKTYVPKSDGRGGFISVYGLVTVLNTRNSDRGPLAMIIFSGINSAGTDGAAGFFSSPRALRDLRAIFNREGVHGFPAAYQVVVKCTFGDLLMISYEYQAHRILQKDY